MLYTVVPAVAMKQSNAEVPQRCKCIKAGLSCTDLCQKFNSSTLERVQQRVGRKRKADGGEPTSHPKRRESTALLCIFL